MYKKDSQGLERETYKFQTLGLMAIRHIDRQPL